jgi:hypothetical protein
MHAMFVGDLARARIDEFVKEADAHRLAGVAMRGRRTRKREEGPRRRLIVIAWRRALAAVALSLAG